MLKPLETAPLLPECLSSSFATPLVFEQMFDASGALWPEGPAQSRGGPLFQTPRRATLAKAVGGHMAKCPSPITVIFFAIFTGPERSGRSSGRGLFHELAGLRRTVDDVEGRRRRRGEQPVA